MRNTLYILLLVGLLIFTYIPEVGARGVTLSYQPVGGDLTYQTIILLDSVVDSGSTHISTRIALSSRMENAITDDNGNLFFKVTFKDIKLEKYNREIQITEKVAHKSGLDDRRDIEVTLRNDVLHKWNNLVITDKGLILEKYFSFDLGKVDFFDMTRIAEQFFILLPDKELEVGQQWVDTYTSIFPPYDQGDPFLGFITYTYLGQEEHMGIVSHKIKAVTYFDQEERMSEDRGMTKASWVSMGNLYFAVDGNYLIESDFTSDFSVFIKMVGEDQTEVKNYIQTGVKYNIQLVTN